MSIRRSFSSTAPKQKVKFQLPQNYFELEALSDSKRNLFSEHVDIAKENFFKLVAQNGPNWLPITQKHGVKCYRNRNLQSQHNTTQIQCKMEFPAQLLEIARVYTTSSSTSVHDYELISNRIFQQLHPKVMDSKILYIVQPRTPERPYTYIGIRWFVIQSSTPLVANRDFCCIEYYDIIEADDSSTPRFIYLLHSIELDECPQLEKNFGFVRGKLQSGALYQQNSLKGLIQVKHIARMDPCGHFPTALANKLTLNLVYTNLTQIRRLVERKRLNANSFVDRSEWVADHLRPNCAVCSRAFGTFRYRHHCRTCGEVICSRCSIFRHVDLPGMDIQKVRLCTMCTAGLRQATGYDTPSETCSDISTSSFLSTKSCRPFYEDMKTIHEDHPETSPTNSVRSTQSVQLPRAYRSSSISRSRNRRSSSLGSKKHTKSSELPQLDLSYLSRCSEVSARLSTLSDLETVGNDLVLPENRKASGTKSKTKMFSVILNKVKQELKATEYLDVVMLLNRVVKELPSTERINTMLDEKQSLFLQIPRLEDLFIALGFICYDNDTDPTKKTFQFQKESYDNTFFNEIQVVIRSNAAEL